LAEVRGKATPKNEGGWGEAQEAVSFSLPDSQRGLQFCVVSKKCKYTLLNIHYSN